MEGESLSFGDNSAAPATETGPGQQTEQSQGDFLGDAPSKDLRILGRHYFRNLTY